MDKKFRYSLIGLQRVQDYQIDQETTQLAALKNELENCKTLIDSLELQIRELEQETIRLLLEQPPFWIESRTAVSIFIAERRTDKQKAIEAQEKLVSEILALMEQIIESQKSRKLLERHKRVMQNIHLRAEDKRHHALLDEHVLRASLFNKQKRKSL